MHSWGLCRGSSGVSVVFVLLVACSNASKDPSTSTPAGTDVVAPSQGPSDAIYDAARRTQIEIELSPADWDGLRYDGRSMAQQTAEIVPDYDYREYLATVRVDGVVYAGVEVQKKGFLGSMSVLRPSLRLDFERGGVEIESGLRRLTLNAALQDRSHARECMAFALFARAGLPAPRCSLARVSVNGLSLGTYTNVEPIRKPMLGRHFSDDEGNLYEGSLADFDDESWERIELETNALSNDRADLLRLVNALKVSDEELVNTLEPLLDLDRFRTFWAVETLIGHWDGYADVANNYYLYHDPVTDRFVFLPWGVDQAFTGQRPFATRPYYPTVYAGATLTRRLYALPEQRELFRRRLAELNDELWDVPALLEQSARIARIVPDVDPEALAAHDEFLRTHGEALRLALGEPAPEPAALEPVAPAPPRSCVGSRPVAGEFSGTWHGQDAAFAVELNIDGTPRSGDFSGTFDRDTANPRLATFTVFSSLDETRGLLLLLNLPEQLLRPGAYPFHGFETSGLLGLTDAGGAFTLLGFIGDGELELTRAGSTEGAPVEGRFDARLYQIACMGPASPGSKP